MKRKGETWIKADAGGVREMKQPSRGQKTLNRGSWKGKPYSSQPNLGAKS